MAQDHGLCRKKGKKSKMNRRTGRHCRPVLQLPTGQFNNFARRSWRTWTEQVGAKQTERGQMMRAVGMAWQRRAGTQSLQNKAAAGKHSRQMICPAQASKQNNSQQMAGLAAKQQLPDDVGRPLAV